MNEVVTLLAFLSAAGGLILWLDGRQYQFEFLEACRREVRHAVFKIFSAQRWAHAWKRAAKNHSSAGLEVLDMALGSRRHWKTKARIFEAEMIEWRHRALVAEEALKTPATIITEVNA